MKYYMLNDFTKEIKFRSEYSGTPTKSSLQELHVTCAITLHGILQSLYRRVKRRCTLNVIIDKLASTHVILRKGQ